MLWDVGFQVIEWSAYGVVSLLHITLDWISLDGRSYGPRGWSGGAMVLGKLPVPGRPTIVITVG